MRGMIYAESPEGVIGVDNAIPWRHPGDFRRFKRVTLGTTIVMGRKTYESMGKPLPGRRNIVVTRAALDVPGVESGRSLEEALSLAGPVDVWVVGGRKVHQEATRYAHVIHGTYLPHHVDRPDPRRAR